jgi:hypothetical protein
MLAHSPPLPLIIQYDDEDSDLTAEDEQGIMFALKHRDRVQRIYLAMPVPFCRSSSRLWMASFPS